MNLLKQLKVKKLVFPFIGLAALIWFLARVIPKPSRATYPCMRATAPLASTFVLYIVGLFASTFVFTKAKNYLRKSNYMLFSDCFICKHCVGVPYLFRLQYKESLCSYTIRIGSA